VSAPRDIAKEFPIEEVLATSERITVYRSIDSRTGGVVVVKLLALPGLSEIQAARHRFLRTVGALESLDSRCFPIVLASGFSKDDRAFIVTKFVDGEPFSRLEDSSPVRIRGLLAKVADALEDAARKNVFHHNLNPENILVVDQNGVEEVFFLGIGSSAYYYRDGGSDQSSSTPETERFVAPELAQRTELTGATDWRSDLYSLAMIAVELLGGRVEGEGSTQPSVTFPDAIRNQLDGPERMTQALEVALRGDPRQRSIGWADLHNILSTEDREDAVAELDMPSLDATVRIPLDRLPKLDLRVDEADSATETDAYRVEYPPQVKGDTYETSQNVSLKVRAPGVLANASDHGGRPLTANLVAGPKHGTLQLRKDGSFTYAPDSDYFGDDGFTYKANNGLQDSNLGSASITVKPVTPVPKAVDFSFSVDEGSTLDVPAPGVLGSVTDGGRQQLKAIAVSQPMNGSLDLRPDGSFVYKPEPTFIGSDSFGFRISNPQLASGAATVTIKVTKTDQPSVVVYETPPEDGRINPPPLPAPSHPSMVSGESAESPPPIPRSSTSADADLPPTTPPPTPRPEVDLVPPPLPRLHSKDLPWLPSRQWAYLIGGIALVFVVVIGLVALWPDPTAEVLPQVAPTAEVPTEVPTPRPAPTEPPQESFHPRLEVAESLLIAGDTDSARAELGALTEDEIDVFTEEEAGFYDHLLSTIEGGRQEEAIDDLRGGLSWSSMKMIRRGMASISAMSQEEISSVPGLAGDIQRGQAAMRTYSRMDSARRAGDNALLLENSTSMIELLPNYGTAQEWREDAASSLEVDAEALADNGQMVRAIATLEPVARWWPERQGLQNRLDRYRALQDENIRRQAEFSDYEKFIAAAIAKGEAGVPEEGLQMLARREVPESLGQQKREAIDGLTAQLARLDASAPEIVLDTGTEFTYRKNEPFQISMQISDDHRVVTAIARLRGENTSQYREIRLAGPVGDSYTLTVGADLHGNGVVQLYFEARDVSGHVGRLGSPSEPFEVKRKGFFDRIRRK